MKYLANTLNIGLLVFSGYALFTQKIHSVGDIMIFVLLVMTSIINMTALHAADDSDSLLNLWLEVKKKNLRKQLSDE